MNDEVLTDGDDMEGRVAQVLPLHGPCMLQTSYKAREGMF
jgi:hypothetical protein